jgi:hypothetical protein
MEKNYVKDTLFYIALGITMLSNGYIKAEVREIQKYFNVDLLQYIDKKTMSTVLRKFVILMLVFWYTRNIQFAIIGTLMLTLLQFLPAIIQTQH